MRTMSKAPVQEARHKAVRKVNLYAANAVAPSTRLAYASDIAHFRAWGGRIPATPAMVTRYLAHFAGTLKTSTLLRRLAAIASAHRAIGQASPVRSDLVRRTMRGIRRVHGSAIKQAAPVSVVMLRDVARPRADLPPLRDLRDRALLLLGFAGGFRRSELVGLRPMDLRFTREGVIVTLRRSKTDPQAAGRTVAIPNGRGRLRITGALMRWIRALRQHDPEAGAAQPLFRRIDRYGNLGAGLGGASVGAILKERLSICGHCVAGISAHSLRAGLVTAAATAGAPTWAIQRQTGHRSERTVHRYIRDMAPFELNAFGSVTSRA